MSVVFLFLDGVGLAPAGADNPLSGAPTRMLNALLGGPLVQETAEHHARSNGTPVVPSTSPVLFKGIDATLGVDGLPQSGTGQTALLAGVNAAQLHGRHQPHVPPVALRSLLAEQSVLRRIIVGGGTAAFANAFTSGYWEALATRRIRRSASVIAAEGAPVRFRDLDDLRRGEALAWDITGAAMHAQGADIPPIQPEQAGTALARLAYTHDLVFYENFLPDLAGHNRVAISIGDVFALLDTLIGAALAHLRPGDTFVLTSDHGNIESLAAPTHTRNPVPLLAVGQGADAFAGVSDISEVADAIMSIRELTR